MKRARKPSESRRPKLVTHLSGSDWVALRRFSPDLAAPRPSLVHDHASAVLYLEGSATFWMQGLYTLGPGDLLLVPPGAQHYAVSASGARALGISLSLSRVPAAARDSLAAAFDGVRRGACASRRLGREACKSLERLFLDLERELASASAVRDVAVDAYVSLVSVAILRARDGLEAANRTPSSPLVARALELVHRRASSGISLRDVAAHLARSPAHVASLVKDATGETVVGWITRARMSECRRLLGSTDESIEAVAARCGFASPSHFHRAFKRAHGVAPGAWRRAHRSS
ncbi:MAG: AraC family transcriptional regulator [Polyangiaceae bacterium]|nr:AraC family transcriptional regulator [Polyangiaceae bacterium]